MYAISPVCASEQAQDAVLDKQSVLKNFVKNMRDGYSRASIFLQDAGIERAAPNLRGLQDGERLILNFTLPDNTRIDGEIFAEQSNLFTVSRCDFRVGFPD